MPYPIIMNGDHAEFEAKYFNVPPKERPDWPLPSFDAKDWAEAFCKVANKYGLKDSDGNPVDKGWITGWFANALMRGFDERSARATGDATADAFRRGAEAARAADVKSVKAKAEKSIATAKNCDELGLCDTEQRAKAQLLLETAEELLALPLPTPEGGK